MNFDEIDLQWFAAEDEGRTEEPSEYKLRKAREEGRVAKSQELCSALVMLITVVVLVIAAPYFWVWLEEVLIFYFSRCTESVVFQRRFFFQFVMLFFRIVIPIAACGMVAGIAANLVQNREFIFTTKTIEPKFSKIAPRIGQYLKKTLFSFEGAFNVCKSLIKVSAIAFAAFLIIRMNLPVILEFLNSSDIHRAVGKIAWTAAQILATCAVIFLAVAVPDYFVQKKQFIESMKMTKQEVKQEYKEMEGDPDSKARLESARRDMLARNMPQQVAKSDVVITNPTHFAVALLYDSVKSDAPEVMAKGMDAVALRIRSIAAENNVPVIENRPLARSLYAETEVGDIIPATYFTVIAAIYSQLGTFNKK